MNGTMSFSQYSTYLLMVCSI